jgi:hypothetical protein
MPFFFKHPPSFSAILILNFFATDLHGLSQIFTGGYLLFCFMVNLLNPSVLIRVHPWLKLELLGCYPSTRQC